jgi:hypothetical protein
MSDRLMRWPGLRRKTWPITVVRVPSLGLNISGPLEFYGCWCSAHIGPWLIFVGTGTYDE